MHIMLFFFSLYTFTLISYVHKIYFFNSKIEHSESPLTPGK